ncbi:MAG TPA: M48 family metalloprotease, partial [Gemmatimonadales bacterium]|nr:M48 family metalloprotease [Gemmatimonadales bacterium]
MDDASFNALVQRLERQAATRPHVYRRRLIALALLGYGYVLTVLVGLVALTGILVLDARIVVLQVALPLLIVIVAMLRALWVRMQPPQGVVLRETDVPSLFELVRRVGRRLEAPRVHVILAVPDVNAGVVQVPRLGVFGGYRNYLVVGLPLMQALSADEWQAVVAHELGHLSGRHGWFGAWIYRIRATWGRLLATIEKSRSRLGQFLFAGFIKWYAPCFNAYSFVLARAHEYEADLAAAELVGSETARRTLLRIEIATRRAARFWGGVHPAVLRTPEPPQDAYRQLRLALRAGGADSELATWVSEAWARPTSNGNTHPALADRLKALGWRSADGSPPAPPEPLTEPSAASVYLGPQENQVELEFDQSWARRFAGSWKERHAQVVAARERLAELDSRSAGSLTAEEEMDRINASGTMGEFDRLRALAEALLLRLPEHPGAHFQVGQYLVRHGDARGVEHIEQAMRRDPAAILPGCRILFDFFRSRGEMENAQRCLDRGRQRDGLLRQARAGRSSLARDIELRPHEWSDEQVTALRDQLRQ